jgi:hypothetical protein
MVLCVRSSVRDCGRVRPVPRLQLSHASTHATSWDLVSRRRALQNFPLPHACPPRVFFTQMRAQIKAPGDDAGNGNSQPVPTYDSRIIHIPTPNIRSYSYHQLSYSRAHYFETQFFQYSIFISIHLHPSLPPPKKGKIAATIGLRRVQKMAFL